MTMLDVVVTSTRMLTPTVRELTLSARSGRLPAFSSGSHIQLCLRTGQRELRNAYSLVGEPGETSDKRNWRIAVRLSDASRGGSAFVHAGIEPGMTLRVTPPVNLFALHATAHRHVLIAGGIGITPMVSHVAELTRRRADFELHYAFRAGASDAYADELRARLGARYRGYDSAIERFDALRTLAAQPLGTHAYVCGPQSLIDAVRDAAGKLGWHAHRVHREAFVAPAPGRPFTATLARSGHCIDVAADQSLLEALESAGVAIPNLCRGGVCGQCATPHLSGEIEHRDQFLSDHERHTHLMPCVSRARGATLSLDL